MPRPATPFARTNALPALALFLACLIPSRLDGQTCIGSAPFRITSARVGADLSLGDGARVAGVHATFGAPRRPFLRVGGAHVDYTESEWDRTATRLSGMFGVEMVLGDSADTQALRVCPMLGLWQQFGADRPGTIAGPSFRVEVRNRYAGVGFAGGLLRLPWAASVAPAGSLTLRSESRTVAALLDWEQTSERYAEVEAGAWLFLARAATLYVSGAMPVGRDDADPRLLVSFEIVFDHRRR